LPTREWKRRARREPWFPGETLITGIGQGFFLATPLQLANATAALAADGKLMQPRVVGAMGESGKTETTPFPAVTVTEVPVKYPANWQRIDQAMVKVVHDVHGTARRISQGIQYKMAGKTGTAQVFSIAQDAEYDAEEIAKRLRDHALFVAFAPADKPTIAVALIVENGGSGSAVAAPIAREVIDYYLLQETQP